MAECHAGIKKARLGGWNRQGNLLMINKKVRSLDHWHLSCMVSFSSASDQPFLRFPPHPLQLTKNMLSWTLTFIIVALIAGVLGFGTLAGAAATVAQVCFVIFLILFVVSLIRGKKPI